MSEEIHAKLMGWLGGELARTEGRQCIQIELVSTPLGGDARGRSLGSWDRTDHPEIFDELVHTEDLVRKVIDLAENEAASFGTGQHRFELRTKQHLGGRKFTSFRIAGSTGMDMLAGGDDRPDATGVLSQQMRFSEFQMKLNMQMFGVSVGSLEARVRELSQENADLRKERRELMQQLERESAERDEREYAMMMGKAADDRKNLLVEKTLSLVPVVGSIAASHFGLGAPPATSGHPGANGAPAAGSSPSQISLALLLSELAKSISDDQLATLRSGLSMHQQLMLAEAIRHARQIEEATAAGKPQASDPHAPASAQTPSPSSSPPQAGAPR